MNLTRKQFISMTAGAAALASVPASSMLASCAQPALSTGKPKRGVSIFCYQGLMHWCMNLEDVFKEMYDMSATGFELLASGYVENYPNPTDEWLEWWHTMMEKYNIVPVEYGHWIDSKLHRPAIEMSTEESYAQLAADIRLANKLGFPVGRTKMGVIDGSNTPVSNWREIIEKALPLAEELNFKMCPEIHVPTRINSKMVDDYIEFIQKTNTKNFGLNIDFGVFATRRIPRETEAQQGAAPGAPAGATAPAGSAQNTALTGMMDYAADQKEAPPNVPADIIPVLPYTYACHAKFNDMSEDCVETTIPYDEIIKILIDHKWDGYLLSEYEGPNKNVPGYPNEQTRRQHVMLKRLLGEV